MERHDEEHGRNPIPGLLILLSLLAGAVAVQNVSLTAFRPVPGGASVQSGGDPHRVRARLWEDPLAAVDGRGRAPPAAPAGYRATLPEECAHLAGTAPEDLQPCLEALSSAGAVLQALAREQESARPDWLALTKQIAQRTANGKVEMMLVMVPGGPSPLAHEARIRDRYAVLAALGVQDFEPDSQEHIRFTAYETPKTTGDPPTRHTVAYEWFSGGRPSQADPKRPDDVLVLWIESDPFRGQPLRVLADLRKRLDPEAKAGFTLLGPHDSGVLRDMIAELHGGWPDEPDRPGEVLPGARIFSWAATAPARGLATSLGIALADHRAPDWTWEQALADLFEDRGIAFQRVIGSDADLARALARELQNRNLCLPGQRSNGCSPTAHVAVVAEWDTVYARALSAAMAEQLHLKQGQLHRFSYLRGIDGRAAGGDATATPARGPDGKRTPATPAAGVERPEGAGQFDYLRRLVRSIRALNARLMRTRDARIQAIGVLGTDRYDKLLVLQALRSSFPETLFFTTDLDAVYLHPEQLPVTRNLIVASHFGLGLDDPAARTIPPFRTGYQTSLFEATRRASSPGTVAAAPAPARLFEIGRSSAVALDTRNAFAGEAGMSSRVNAAGLLCLGTGAILVLLLALVQRRFPLRSHGLRFCGVRYAAAVVPLCAVTAATLYFLEPVGAHYHSRSFGSLAFVMFVSGLALASAAVCLSQTAFGDVDLPQRHTGSERLKLLPVLVLTAGVFGIFWIVRLQGTGGEPFLLFEGISVWPTQAIRVFASALAIYFLVLGWRVNQLNLDDLERRYLPGARPGAGSTWAPWAEMRVWERVPRSLWIVVLASAGYFAFGYRVIVTIGMPLSPVRGDLAWYVDRIVTLGLAVPLMIGLIIATLYSCTHGVRLFHELSRRPHAWPRAVRMREAKRLGVSARYVGDWITVDVIARRSEVLSRLIYLPALIILLNAASRLRVFDAWTWPLGLVIVVCGSALLLAICEIMLRAQARKARKRVIDRLERRVRRLHPLRPASDARIEQIEYIVQCVRERRRGAFLPFWQQPLVRSVMLLLGGGSSLVLLEFLALVD